MRRRTIYCLEVVAPLSPRSTAVTKSDDVATLHWQGKIRGPDFAPASFILKAATTERLKDSRGRLIATVVAAALSEREQRDAEATTFSDENWLLVTMLKHERASFAGLADLLGWQTKTGAPDKSKVQRVIGRLKRDKYAKIERNTAALTEKGKTEANRVKNTGQYAQYDLEARRGESL
jgi:hypothetical protein